MRLFGFGKDLSFNVMLEAQADAAIRAARAFREMIDDFAAAPAHAERIKKIETEADEVTHQLANKVDATFVTPLDKEDLNALSSQLDDITDVIEAASARIVLYQLRTPLPALTPLADCLVEITLATRASVDALRTLHGRDALRDVLIRVHEAENRGDQLYRQALADLFNAPDANPLLVLKWKEVYDRIEQAYDACEDVSNVVESVAIKYA